ncbi:MAG: tetratricopeptide repeat protein [Nitrospinaceae bacterium]
MRKTKKHAADKFPGQRGAFGGGFLAGGIKPILFLTAVGGLIWGLVTLAGPERHLEPYNPGEDSLASPVSTDGPVKENAAADSPAAPEGSPDLETVAQADPPSSGEELSPALETIAAVDSTLQLPRATLQHISRGMGLAEQGKYELAELEFEKAAEISPNSSEVFAIWGAAHRMQGKFEGANKRFKRANELAPDDEEILFNWGLSRLHEKKAAAAIRLFKATLELDPKHYMAYNYLGKSYGQSKDYAREAAAYRDALKIKEDFAQGHFNLGVVLSLMKEFEEAAPHFQRAIALDPEFDKPFVNQFLVAMGLNKKPQADLKPSHPSAKSSAEKAAEKPPAKETETPEKTAGAKAAEGSHKDAPKAEEGSEGSGEKIVNPITRVQGTVTINGEPAGPAGLVILETKTKLKAPQQKVSQLRIMQRELSFQPQHSVVMVGSTVEFINDDREVHNIFSKSQNNQFNLGAMAAGSARSIKLTQPGPVVLRCNLHKDMIGTLFVAPNGYYAKVDAQGHYTLPEVKSQEYILQFWHPRLPPEEVEKDMKSVSLTGVDQTLDFAIVTQSAPGDIHDMVDPTDYNLLVTHIENEVREAIRNWRDGKKYLSHKRMLKAITYYYEGGGLKGALAKSFSEKRSRNLENALDAIRKKIAGLDKKEPVTEDRLNALAERVFSQLHNNVRELYARLNPDSNPLP